MDELNLKEIQEDVRLYAKWYNEHLPFIKQIFEHAELRQAIECIPGTLYSVCHTIVKANKVSDSLLEDISLFLEGSSFLSDVIDIYEFVYKEKNDFKQLVKQSELFNLLFLAQDLLDFISDVTPYDTFQQDNEYLGSLVSEISNRIYQNQDIETDFIKESYDQIDNITSRLKEEDSYTPLNYFFEEISLEKKIPFINLEALNLDTI